MAIAAPTGYHREGARVLSVQTVLTTVEKKGFSGYGSAIASVGTRLRRGVEINA